MFSLTQLTIKILENVNVKRELEFKFKCFRVNHQQKSVCFTGTSDTFTVTFICNDSYPGELKFVREEINSVLNIHDTFFEFHTALACAPAPVDCQVTGKYLEFG